MMKLTVEKLKAMQPGEIFSKGLCEIVHPWYNDAKETVNEEKKTTVKYVAVRGKGMHDWCVYHSLDANLEPARYLDGVEHLNASFELIADVGAKMHPEEAFKLFDIDEEEVKELYRY